MEQTRPKQTLFMYPKQMSIL